MGAINECFLASEGSSFLIRNLALVLFLLVTLMIVKEAGYPSLERRCLLQITDGTSAVEELPLQLRGNRIPAHKHGRPRHFKICSSSSTRAALLSVILSPLNRLYRD
jgi:hypothetical protein